MSAGKLAKALQDKSNLQDMLKQLLPRMEEFHEAAKGIEAMDAGRKQWDRYRQAEREVPDTLRRARAVLERTYKSD